ncbi:MAG: cobalamin-dependent protein [Armatimonadota bacterium]
MGRGTILAAAMGDCVHVAGLHAFLRLADAAGYETRFLGPAVSAETLAQEVRKHRPQTVALSYRLTPASAREVLNAVRRAIPEGERPGIRFIFGGTPPVAAVAAETGLFERVFDGTEGPDEIMAFLEGRPSDPRADEYPAALVSRLEAAAPSPIIRHHFGSPSLEETIAGARRIAEAHALDVLSLGPDQNAQEHFFHPERMDPAQDGAGGVPVRRPEDLAAMHTATRCGNFPLLRCYSGTNDLVQWGQMLQETISIAWGAVPLFWYSALDGRSQRPLPEAIRENQEAIAWYASQGIPVEVNDPHQWALRDAHDSLAVAVAYLAAYNARRLGVSMYVAQYMLNTPPDLSPAMDLAKALAAKELIESLADADFQALTEVRPGLRSFPGDFARAKGHLAASAVLSLTLRPHILHVVGFSEGHHAILADELIESCQIARGALTGNLEDFPDMLSSSRVQERKQELLREADVLLEALRDVPGAPSCDDPWADPDCLARAVELGILDAPHLCGSGVAPGRVVTGCIDGAYWALDPETGKPLREQDRLAPLLAAARPS